MKMISVDTPAKEKEFLEFPVRLYKNDNQYIRPLDKDIREVFDTGKNKFFRHGECARWLCIDDAGNTLGKVAAFINKKYKQEQPTGGIGFFDCVHDRQVSRFIFDHCRQWLAERGMEAMDGPINFGERDKWWGLVVEGFKEPLYGMNYNPPYYRELFEDYGFKVYFYQLCFGRSVGGPVSPAFTEAHKRLSDNGVLRAERITKDKIDRYAKDFTEVYNKAWASHGQGKQLEERQAIKMFRSMKPVLNEHISWIIYEQEQPIAMWINLPDLNQWFKYLHGRFGLLQKLKFLFLRATKANSNIVGLVFGIIPEWQRKGVDGYMIWEGTRHMRKYTRFENYEMQWIGDFNPKMISIARNLDTEVTRKLATYRYLFDRTKEFHRHPVL